MFNYSHQQPQPQHEAMDNGLLQSIHAFIYKQTN